MTESLPPPTRARSANVIWSATKPADPRCDILEFVHQ